MSQGAVTGTSLAEAWAQRVARSRDAVALTYFDRSLTAAEVDRLAEALGAGLQDLGVRRGDRVGIRLQNVPQFPITLLALWKIGAVAVPINPMYRAAELRHLITDSGAVGVLCEAGEDGDLHQALDQADTWVLTTASRSWQGRDDARVFDVDGGAGAGAGDEGAGLEQLLAQHTNQRARPVRIGPDDIAMLTYTSGTTGPAKGAMNTHANVLSAAGAYARWVELDHDVVLAIAPLFHITGAVLNGVLALLHDAQLVLADRFRAEVVRDAIKEHRVTFTIGAITAFNALLQVSNAEDLRSFRRVYSGGAPIPPALVERVRHDAGFYIHNVYGMTETTSAVIAVPPDTTAPVDAASGTLSVGVPLPGVVARIVDEKGDPVPDGVEGELELSAPQVVPGYWNNPAATGRAMPKGRLRTGDVAIRDAEGWIYLVDRLKDQINVSGYKVWPREVEDVLYQHPAVIEAAVVGKPDDYSGERVEAYVSLRDAVTAPEDLTAFVRTRLAAYKCPRRVHVVSDLPKTATGKIRRASLRCS